MIEKKKKKKYKNLFLYYYIYLFINKSYNKLFFIYKILNMGS